MSQIAIHNGRKIGKSTIKYTGNGVHMKIDIGPGSIHVYPGSIIDGLWGVAILPLQVCPANSIIYVWDRNKAHAWVTRLKMLDSAPCVVRLFGKGFRERFLTIDEKKTQSIVTLLKPFTCRKIIVEADGFTVIRNMNQRFEENDIIGFDATQLLDFYEHFG